MQLLEVTQRTLEAYETRLLAKGEETRSAAAFNRILIECATEAGIAAGLPADLGALKPWQVAEWSLEINAHISAAKSPPTEGES